MAASILSQDILAICLFVARGNINLSMEEIIRRVENYQEKKDRHFGISRSDFRGLFLMLFCWELEIKSFGNNIDDIKLLDIIPDILKYYDAHFNDEGEHWIQKEEQEFGTIKYWFGYDEKEYQEKRIVKKNIKRFFEHHEISKINSESVGNLMKENKITEEILYYCSRIGKSN